MSRLFIIGNGVDLANGLPTDFHNDFRPIAKRNETSSEFWELYSDAEREIWSDFEESLARPELDRLWEELFQPYSPDYSSDRESDRNGMIWMAEGTGKLRQSLLEFAQKAENALGNITNPVFLPEFPVRDDDHVISFNYTSTVESKYNVRADQVTHVHGKVGETELTLGFNRTRYKPTDIFVDIHHGQGYWATWDIYAKKKTLDDIPVEQREYYDGSDYYIDTAQDMFERTIRSFEKPYRLDCIDRLPNGIVDIVVVGHSLGFSDQPYFEALANKYPDALWKITWHNDQEKIGMTERMGVFGIQRYELVNF